MNGSTPSDIYVGLTYADASAAIEFLCAAFGFQRRLVVPGPDGAVMHSELTFGTGVVMVSSPKAEQRRVAPGALGVPCTVSVFTENVDAHHDRAAAAGAKILQPPTDEEYGARGYMAQDPGGHTWYFGSYRPGRYWDAADEA